MTEFIQYFLEFAGQMGYFGVVLLMAIESSFIPFPSEVVIPPAAYLASRGEMNIFLVVVAGIIGSLIGAIVNYFLAFWLGRTVIYKLSEKKFFKLLLIDSSKIKKAEDLFLSRGSLATFFGRLIPVVRQLISLPAGFFKMNFFKFIFYTTLGSGVWVAILAVLGYWFGENQELLKKYYQEISISGVIIGVVFCIWFFAVKKKKS